MKLRIGWVPWCYYEETGDKKALGAWNFFLSRTKTEARKAVRNEGFKFKILPVFVDVPEK